MLLDYAERLLEWRNGVIRLAEKRDVALFTVAAIAKTDSHFSMTRSDEVPSPAKGD